MDIKISNIPSTPYIYQNFGPDTNNIPFTPPTKQPLSGSGDIEFYIFDLNNNILFENYNFSDYSIYNEGQLPLTNIISSIYVDLEKQIRDAELLDGEYITYFNFFTPKIGSFDSNLSIKEISGDRKELRFTSPLGNIEEITNFIGEISSLDNSNFPYFYLNFGENKQIIGVNLISNEDGNFIKLYQPLPEEFDINSPFWVVTSITDPIAYNTKLESEVFIPIETTDIKGPNFNLDIKDQVNNSTNNLSYQDLIQTNFTSSYNQIENILQEKGLNININYKNFSNFTHFSSAKTRLENFFYKITLIEEYSSSIDVLNTTNSPEISSSKAIYENKINNIITSFDGYDYFLYYDSSSFSWPKSTSTKPYQLAKSNSTEVKTWLGNTNPDSPLYGGIILSASLYDEKNLNSLYYSIPEYLRDDPDNSQYELFIDMVAQHFDNIWIYYKDVSQKYNADNRLEQGISKDIVADAIRDFGIKLYQNNFSNNDLYTAFLGLTPNGGLFPFPNITGSLPTPTGFEYIDQFISASNDVIPLDDVNKSLYKRIYHNIPYLLKAKGTIPGLRALITSYGIPDTILRINEYGGKDKINVNDWDHWQREFNYAFKTDGNNFITSSWDIDSGIWGTSDDVPESVMFRFKTNGLPTTNIPYSQSLWSKNNDSHLSLRYTGSAYVSASYSGSIKDPYYQYAYLDFYPNYASEPTVSCSVYLPFFDGEWWSVMINKTSGFPTDSYSLYSANNIYEQGENGTQIGFISSSTINTTQNDWGNSGISTFASSSNINGNIYTQFSGSLQEIRYCAVPISESVFKDYTMNPHSIEGNNINSSPNELIFRAPLGGELYTGSVSIHPKVTGSWVATQSFTDGSNSNFYFNATPTFVPNIEMFFADQPIAGIKNIISDKIRIENDIIPSGNTLSSFTSLAQTTNISQSYTPNINYLEVAFSPQNEINEDIMDQIGFFDIGEYIGDPRLRSSSATSYPDLDNLRDDYFKKYTKNYNLKDFVRLIKFFDNSLFKMIKDFVPARTSLASGVVVKQHLLERNKYPQPQLSFTNTELSGTLKPQWNGYEEGRIVNTIGGTGGSFEIFNNTTTSPSGSLGNGPNNRYGITQSWDETISTLSGSVVKTYTNQDEFYDGIFNGTILVVTTQSIGFPLAMENQSSEYNQVHYYGTFSKESDAFENVFLNPITSPQNGEILFYHDETPFPTIWDTKYLKISKNDCNGVNNSSILESITVVYIFIPYYNVYVPYNVEILNEQSNYYLYGLTQTQLYSPNLWPNQVLDYFVSASTPNNFGINPIDTPIVKYSTVIGNTLGYFNQNPGSYILENTPNTPLIISASFSYRDGSGPDQGVTSSISKLVNGNFIPIKSFNSTAPGNVTLNTSYYGLNGDNIYLTTKANTSLNGPTFISASILITQSRAVSSSLCYPVIFEPYITTTNFFNSDENAIINNISNSILSNIYQDVDYSTNILTPTNFNQLISGSATKAPIQDSNYSSKAYTGIRYDGSKSTSKLLNTWSPGDKGTYGKLPTIESDKVYVAYGDMEGGWPPERMNASSFGIRYLISQDGDVVIPNVSENSLYITQGTFQTGERFRVSSKTEGFGDPEWEYRDIIRGGNTIQPILYTQIGKQPGALWTSSIELIDIQATSGSTTSNYQNNGSLSEKPDYQLRDRFSFTPGTTNNNLIQSATYSVTGNDYNFYQTPIGVLNEAITLNIQITNLQAKFRQFGSDLLPYTYGPIAKGVFGVILKIKTNGNDTTYALQQQELPEGSFTAQVFDNVQGQTGQLLNLDDINFSIPPGVLQENSEVSIEYVFDNEILNLKVKIIGGSYSITQIPIPTELITVGTNNIWGYYDKTNYPYIITSSNAVSSSLGAFYGDPNVKQEDISGSGFNPITFPWSIEYGDEFRFEGDERFSYTVGPVFGPNETVFTYPYKKITQQRLSPTGSIEVHFNSNLPVSASIDSFNLDHFLIRRYTDDASRIIFEDFKPPGSEGPYILTPEYASDKLNKSVDEYISDLTQKGLL